MKHAPTWTHPALSMVIRAIVATYGVIPVDQNLRTMRSLGGAFGSARFNRERRERAHRNLAWCFPEWPRWKVEACALDAYSHLFCLAAEMMATERKITTDGFADRVRLGNTRGVIERLVRGERLIFITGHCGNWEALGYTLAALGFPMHALYRPLDLKPLDAWVRETRERRGLMLLDKFGAAERMPGILAQGGRVAFIADQNAGNRGLFVPFFDRLASTYKSIGLLALTTDTPIVCGHARRLASPGAAGLVGELDMAAQSFRYEIDVVDVIEPDDWADETDPLFYVAARYRRAIETMVRRAPEQYLWMHRYWKSRPGFEMKGREFPARLREKIEALPWMTEESMGRIVERSALDAAEAAAGV